jgi:predicted aldo/keto reductase-like oxidoreductase
LGIESWISEKKKNGLIGQIGFSFHGTVGEFLKILGAYPWEFTQIQYNYSDENYQAGVRGLKKAAETMPVIIMEPLLGGKLANGLPREALELFRAFPGHEYSPAARGLRWLWNQEEVTVVLSGMTSPAQIAENAALTDECSAGSFSAEELALYGKVKEIFYASYKIHCTGCAYCMPCPRGVNIPGCFAAYNTLFVMGWFAGMQQYVINNAIVSPQSAGPKNCVACGKCESHCPQKIPIIESLKTVRKKMEPFQISVALKAGHKFMKLVKKS